MKLISTQEAKRAFYNDTYFSLTCDSAGNAELIRGGLLTPQEIQSYHSEHYRPQNMAIFINGAKLNLNTLRNHLSQLLSDCHQMAKPKKEYFGINSDSLKILSLPAKEDCILMACSWEIQNENFAASKILLEFFKKNSNVLFSQFEYEMNIVNAQKTNICVIFEDFEELDEEKMCHKMKQSIAEYMNRVPKETFLDCLKNALISSQNRTLGESENISSQISSYLHGNTISNISKYENLINKDFDHWYKVAKSWVRSPWMVLVTNGCKRLWTNPNIKRNPSTPISTEKREICMENNFDNAISVKSALEIVLNNSKKSPPPYSTFYFAYDISKIKRVRTVKRFFVTLFSTAFLRFLNSINGSIMLLRIDLLAY